MTPPPVPLSDRFRLSAIAETWRHAFYVALVRANGPALRWESDGPSQWGSCYEIGKVGQLVVAKLRFADHPPLPGALDEAVFGLDCRLPLLADAEALLRMAPCPWQMGTRAAPLFREVIAEWKSAGEAAARQKAPGPSVDAFIRQARAHLAIGVAVWQAEGVKP